MGRIFKVDFDQADVPFFICRYCGTEIAKDRYRYLVDLGAEKPVIYFDTVVNLVYFDEQEQDHRVEGNKTVVDVNCVMCNSLFGFKIIRAEPVGNEPPNVRARVRTFGMYINKLLMWDGNVVLAADNGM